MSDIFHFWSLIEKSATIHPKDKVIFDRLKSSHGFDLRCLPANFAGKLRTAPITLLYLSPGFSEFDVAIAATEEGQSHYIDQRTGDAPLVDLNPAAANWRKSRLKWIGDSESFPERVAVANIGAYHSKNFLDHHILAALPSSRAMLDWAQNVLFPQAERGERMVVCLRAANFWGLESGNKYGKCLFAPDTTRGGHMKKGGLRQEIETIAKAFLVK